MPTFLWGLRSDILTLPPDACAELRDAARGKGPEQILREKLSRAWLKTEDPALYERAVAEGELGGLCPLRIATEVLAQRLLFVCAESGKGVPSEDLLTLSDRETAERYDESAEQEPSIRVLVKAVDLPFDAVLSNAIHVDGLDKVFMDCIIKNRIASALLLLNAGVNPNTIRNYGYTPLECAARCGSTDVVKVLLDFGASVEAQDAEGRTALHLTAGRDRRIENMFQAATYEREGVVRFLLESGANVEAEDSQGQTPLILAAENGREAVVKALLDFGASVEVSDSKGYTPLIRAATYGREGVVRFLLESGANVEAEDSEGRTPLISAAGSGTEAVVKALLESGGNLEARDSLGRTPLNSAVVCGNEDVLKVLLDSGANVEASDGEGRTPLMHAAAKERGSVVKLLLKFGAKGRRDIAKYAPRRNPNPFIRSALLRQQEAELP